MMEVADAAPARASRRVRRAWIGAGAGIALLACAGAFVATRVHHGPSAMQTVQRAPGLHPADLPAALDAPDAVLAAHVTAARAGGSDVLGQARAMASALSASMQAHGATVVTRVDGTPPARSIEALFAAVDAHDGRLTSLDLARLGAATLRAAGARDVHVAERTQGPRADVPADPTGLLGAYVVVLDREHVLDVQAVELLPTAEAQPRSLDEPQLAGAMLAQSALASVARGAAERDHALALANAAVDAWRDGTVPLAVRSYAWRNAGGAANPLADQDLQSAIGLRDGAPLHLLRARLAIARGDGRTAVSEAHVAYQHAHGWGEAALADAAVAGSRAQGDGGDRCAPLAAAREAWTDDALIVCRADGTQPADTAAAAQRLLAASGADPLRVATAGAGGASPDGALGSQVRAEDREELANWLAVWGRRDLAARVMGRTPDAQ